MEVLPDPANEPTFANVLLYGPPKCGKTTAAASAPGVVVHINADLPNATRHARKLDTDGRVMWLKWGGYAMLHEIMAAVYREPRFADTVVLDTYGEAYRRLLEESTDGARRPTMDARGNVVIDLERFARYMCEAPVNFVIVCHEQTEKDDDEGGFRSIAFTGSKSGSPTQSPKLMGMVDIVGYCGRIEREGADPVYAAQLVPTHGRMAGDRFDVLAKDGAWRPLDLTEWLTVAGCWTGQEPTEPQTQTHKQEAVAA